MERICVALDVEMTGTRPGTDEIIEVAAVKFQGHEMLDIFSQLVRPRHTLPLKITHLTGITSEMLADAPTFNEIAPDFVAFIKNYPLVGHSVNFDLDMLRAQGMRFAQPVYDTFDLATLLLPGMPAYRLSTLAEQLNLSTGNQHRALNDADVSRQLFVYLVERIEALDLHELAAVKRLMDLTDWSTRELLSTILGEKTGDAWNAPLPAPVPTETLKRPSPQSEDKPLRPTGDTTPVDAAAVAAFFEPGGLLSQHFVAYEQRSQQAQMAQAITATFNNSDTLVVEAGTGTGKSMAYLVPAALFALQRGERVVLSTNTINLQDQLFAKDIPDVQRMLADATRHNQDNEAVSALPARLPPLKTALLKGRNNYICLKRYHKLRQETNLQPHEARALLKVHFWLPTTSTGDRAELLLMDRENVAWNRINATPETCSGAECFRDCFFFKARRQAEAAHLLVVNHALLLADIAAQGSVLPPYEHVIIDEAHNLEDVATEQFSFRVDQTALLQFLDSLFQEGGTQTVGGLLSEYQNHFRGSDATQEAYDRARQIADALRPSIERARQHTYDCFNQVHAFVVQTMSSQNSYEARLRLTDSVRRKPEWEAIELAWENLHLTLTHIGDGLGQFESLLHDLETAGLLEYDELRLRVEWLRRYATEARIQMGHIIFGNEESICWIGHDQLRNTLTLNAAPLNVAQLLQTQLFAEKQTTVLTSATLAVNDTFAFLKTRLGLHEPEELQLDSPFDYQQQALVYIPDDIPEPNHQGFQPRVQEALIGLCTATQGRTLVLFTSYNALQQTYYAILEPLEEQGISLLGQGIDGSRRTLLEQFKEWPRTVLLGTSSFWEGIDVVGEALSALVIVKLPFQVPSDPIFAARSEQCSEPFLDYAVPQSILKFKQGFGRLIRSQEDRGLVVVLDRRLIKKRYGQQFLQSLPTTSVRTGTLRQLPGLAARFLGHPTGSRTRG